MCVCVKVDVCLYVFVCTFEGGCLCCVRACMRVCERTYKIEAYGGNRDTGAGGVDMKVATGSMRWPFWHMQAVMRKGKLKPAIHVRPNVCADYLPVRLLRHVCM